MNGIIYVAKCTIDGRVYVGQTTQRLLHRVKQHCVIKTGTQFSLAIQEHGSDSFTWEAIHEGIQTRDELNRLEAESIALFDSTNSERGYNCHVGRFVPPPGGRVRITVNLPMDLLEVVVAMSGRSQSDKIVGLISRLSQPPKKASKK